MGLLKDIFVRPKKDVQGKEYTTFTEYSPVFSSFSGALHEQELTRACIERFATATSKLKPEIYGNAKPAITRAVNTYPNSKMTWNTFLKRLGAIYESDGTAFVVPEYAWDAKTIQGLFPIKCADAVILEHIGEPWIRFDFPTGENAAFPLSDVCIISKFQYYSDFFGDDNCLQATMDLLHSQEEAQEFAIKNGANIRFIGALAGQVREEDMEKKRKRFIDSNLSSQNTSGLMLYDQTFTSIQQINPQNYTISSDEMSRIEDNVFNYFGINKNILQNSYDENQWGAWYEGKVEPFAIALSDGLTKMLFTQREQLHNRISFSSNRLEYASNASKRNMIRDMIDRGVFTINQALEILQLPQIGEEGDIRVIRGEYLNAENISKQVSLTDEERPDFDGDLTRNPWEPMLPDTEN